MKKVLVLGAGGFIGSHLVKFLKSQGKWVKGADLKYPDFSPTAADEFRIGDLRDPAFVKEILDLPFDEVYQLAADMGGAGYLFTGENDADIMHNSVMINLNVLHYGQKAGIKKLFYSSSACVYPEFNQEDPENPNCREDSVYPAQPDSDYGWEKLFSERLYAAFERNYGMTIKVGRFHNIFGEEGTYDGGKEKAPAALCRKVAQAQEDDAIEIWGDGLQTRSFLHVSECVEAISRLMDSETFHGPVNIGSEEMVSINRLAETIIELSGKTIRLKHIPGPLGVRGRNSDNALIFERLHWKPHRPLAQGLAATFRWIDTQVKQKAALNQA